MMSCTSVDLPDPLTPVTHVNVPSGNDTSMFFRLCGDAPVTRSRWPVPRRRGRHRDGQLVAQVLRGQRPRVAPQALERALEHDASALLARAQPEVDDVVGDGDHVRVVLDDEHGVALIAKLPQDPDQPQVVAGVQPDGRLVEHVQRVHQRRAEGCGQVDALRLAARERRRQAIECQVVQPDVGEEPQPLADLVQHLVGDCGILLAELEIAEERLRLADRHRRARRSSARHADVARLAPQPRAPALGAVR